MKWQGHLVNTDDPILRGTRVDTQCGKEMIAACFVPMNIIPGELMGKETLREIDLMCPKCAETDLVRRRVYFVLDAETLRHFGRRMEGQE